MTASPDSKYLAERMISRLSKSQVQALEQRLRRRLNALDLPEPDSDGYGVAREDLVKAGHLYNMLGRLVAMT